MQTRCATTGSAKRSVGYGLLALALAGAAAGCSSDDSEGTLGDQGPIASVGAELAGIYELTEFTQNDAGCESEGPSMLATIQETYFFIANRTTLGTDAVDLVSCSDLIDCKSKYALHQSGSGYGLEYSYWFHSADENGQLHGEAQDTGRGGEGVCQEPTRTVTVLTSNADSTLRLEVQEFIGDDFAPDAEGICWSDEGAKATRGKPCSRLSALQGRLVEAL